MVPLTRLNGAALHLSADLIATVEEHHDTVVTLVDGKCLVVAESAEQVVAGVVRHRAEVIALSERLLALPAVHPTRSETHRSDAHRSEASRSDAPRADAAGARVLALRPESE